MSSAEHWMPIVLGETLRAFSGLWCEREMVVRDVLEL